MSLNLESLVLDWAEQKGILKDGTVEGQLSKLHEEFDELHQAIKDKNPAEIADAIGDMQVVLIILAEMQRMSAYKSLQGAYEVIMQRTGKMVNGVFVKSDDL